MIITSSDGIRYHMVIYHQSDVLCRVRVRLSGIISIVKGYHQRYSQLYTNYLGDIANSNMILPDCQYIEQHI